MRLRVLLLAALAALAVALGVIASRKAPANGAKQGVAHRIVSLSPSTTEAVFAIGAGKALVGRSRYCDYPPEVTALPQVGGYVDPNLEAILALQPDLVVGARGPSGRSLVDRLDARHVRWFFPPTETMADVDAMIVGLGEFTSRRDEARRVVTSMHERLEAIDRALAKEPVVRTLLVFGLEPIVVAGPGSFPDEMLHHARGENVVREGGSYPVLGFERIVVLKPELIVDASMAESDRERITPDAPGWKELEAVREGRVVPLKDESVLRPGPRLVDGVAVMARALHPKAVVP